MNGSMIGRLFSHIRTPLYRNGYSLVLSAFATSGLGLLYWMLAARLYPVEVVGLNSAALSAVFFLSSAAQFNLVNALNRFLPSSGKQARGLILGSYAASAALSLLVGLVFIAGLSLWSPRLSFLTSSGWFAAAFVVSVVAWGVFALQDSALTGLRQAVWVPVENIVFSVLKIGLLVVFASLIPAYGILASWLVPMLLALWVINGLMFGRLVPRHAREAKTEEPVSARLVANYAAGDYLGSLFWMAAAHLQPVIITNIAGPEANAYFFLAWQIGYALYLVSRNMGMSLIAEAAADPARLNAYSYRILRQSALLVVPVVLVLLVGAPLILRIFGQAYADEGAVLLRLLGLSAIPQILVALALSIARVRRDMKMLVITQAALSILVLGLIFLLTGPMGITGIGVAWLVGQSLLALILSLTYLRPILLANLDLRLPLRVLGRLRGSLGRRAGTRQLESAGSLLEEILPETIPVTGGASPAQPGAEAEPTQGWRPLGMIQTVSDVTVITLGEEGSPPRALLKLARSDKAAASLQSQNAVLSALREDPRLDGWTRLLPSMHREGTAQGQYYQLEGMLPGVDAREVLSRPGQPGLFLQAAAAAVGELHRRTARVVAVGPELSAAWVDERVALVRGLYGERATLVGRLLLANGEKGLDRLSYQLHQALDGCELAVATIHGDYAPGNILVAPEGDQVVGIIDWDLSGEDLPLIDLVHLLLSVRILLRRRELGDVIRALLEGDDPWSEEELALLEAAQAGLPGEALDMRSLLQLAWLRHIASNLSKSNRYGSNWLWLTKNVEGVLGSI